ncbi:MAG: TolC family protein, partial [bacterium]|nr:TolC family protein [bacterium]
MRWVAMKWAAILIVVVSPGWALTLEEAITTALASNPEVAAARGRLAEADARIRQARSGFFPKLGIGGIAKVGMSGATNQLGLVGLPNSPFFNNLAVSLNAYQPVYDGGRTKFRVEFERRRREAIEAETRGVEADVALETERAFFELLSAGKSSGVAAQRVKAWELTVRQARAFYEAGLRSRIDVDLAEVELARAKLALIEALNEEREAMAVLGMAMGSSQDIVDTIEEPRVDTPSPEALSDLIEEAIRTRP